MIISFKPRHFSLVRVFAWLAISWERLWPRIVPALLVVAGFFVVSWFGLWQVLPTVLHIALIAFFIGLFAYSLRYLLSFRLPDSAVVERRIEIQSELADRPVTAQSDQLSLGDQDDFAKTLWRAHKIRMANRLANLRSGPAKASGDQHDQFGLRYILPIIAFVAYMASTGTGSSIYDAVSPPDDRAELLTRLDIWIEPPAYTAKPPIYLSTKNLQPERDVIIVPQHSIMKARFAGEGDVRLEFGDGKNQAEIAVENKPDEILFSAELVRDGILRMRRGDREVFRWVIGLIVDEAPSIKFNAIPDSSAAGSLQLSYQVKDDYGVVSAIAEIVPIDTGERENSDYPENERVAAHVVRPGAIGLVDPPVVKLPLPRRRAKSGKSKVNRDLSKHPLAGGRVAITLIARDDAGQEGRSETVTIVLPGRNFSDPVSKAVIEQRRILAGDKRDRLKVSNMLDALTTAPEEMIANLGTFLSLKIAQRRLIAAKSDDQYRDILDLMWDVALGIEYGKLSDAEQRLRNAQEKLSEALERGASDEEIDQLMKELRQAMNELMQALAQQNTAQQNQQNNNNNAQTMRQQDLQKMLDRIENLAKSGSKDAARELLAQMQRLMDNLRTGRHQQQRQQEGDETNQALNKLGEMMRQQQELMNETFRMQQQDPGKGENNGRQNRNNQQNGQQENQQGNPQSQRNNPNDANPDGDMTPQEYADALKQLQDQQKALQQQLNDLNEQLRELGLQPSADLGEAGKQMGKAGKQLGQGEAGPAVDNQGNALAALRRGAQSIMQQMAGDRQQGGRQQGQGQQGSGQTMQDPLGRQKGSRGPILGADTKVPGEIDAEMARRVLEAIRDRLSNPLQQLLEKNYLERLLKSQ